MQYENLLDSHNNITSSPSSLIHRGMGVPQYLFLDIAQSLASLNQLANLFSLTNSGTLQLQSFKLYWRKMLLFLK